MKKTPRVSAETRGVRESGDDGAHRPTAAGCVFRAVGSTRAQRRGRCRVGTVRCGCFSVEGGGRAVGRPAVRGRCGAGAGAEAAAVCVFQQGVARRTAGAVRAAEGRGREVNAVGTAGRALVEAPVGFEKALEGIGCRGGGVDACGGAGVEHVGRGAGGDGRRESGGGEHRAERGDEGVEKRRSGAAHRHAGPPRAGAVCVFRLGAVRGRAQRSSSTSTTGRVWRLKILPLPSLMGITVAR